MKVELSIKDDRELRAHIKEAIRAEVLSIARGEIRGIIAEVCGKITSEECKDKIDTIAKNVIKEGVSKLINHSVWGRDSYAKQVIREQVKEILENGFKNKSLP